MKISWTAVAEVALGVLIGGVVMYFVTLLLKKYLVENFDFDFDEE